LGDLHLGNVNTDEELIRQTARRLKEPNTYWVDLGDACEFINMRDPRFDPGSLPDWVDPGDLADLPSVQIRRYKEIFYPVRKTCLARLKGNHEDTLHRKYERDVYDELNKSIGLHKRKALGFSGFLRLRIIRKVKTDYWTLVCFLHHGAGGGMLAGAKALRLERLPLAWDADIYAVGHTHTKLALSKRRIGMESRSLAVKEKPLIMLNVGGFMRGERGGYVERRGLYPQGLGPVEVWLWPSKGDQREWKVVV
jgi:hypothetical protein